MDNFTTTGHFSATGRNSTYFNNVTPGFTILWTCLLFVVAILSCTGNFLVSFTLYRRKYLLTSSNKLVFSLTISNFAYGALVFPFSITSSMTGNWLFGKVWCSLTGFLTTSLFGSSLLTLSLISYDRYYAVVHPLKYPHDISSCRVTAVIIICWLVALLCAFPPLFGIWSQYQFYPSKFGCFPLLAKNHGFSLFWFLICCLIPLCCMISMYCTIFGVAREKYRNATNRQKHVALRRRSQCYEKTPTPVKTAFVFGPDERPYLATRTKDTPSPSRGFYELQATSNLSYVDDSGIVSSDFAGCSQQLQSVIETSPHEPMYNEEKPHNTSNRNAHASSCSGTYFKSLHNPKVKDTEVVVAGRTCSVQSRVLRTDSLSSSTRSHHRQSSQKRNFRFSYFRYYKNQRKACCTISIIVGCVLFAVGPFVVVSMVETFRSSENYVVNSSGTVPAYRHVAIADWLMSLSTIAMYTTCVYYPVIYGLWNETVRHEMMSIICGKSRAPRTRRTRILSLSTHIKDLGLSPRLTAAIMDESVAVAAVVYPMHVESKSGKRGSRSSARKKAKVPQTSKAKRTVKPAVAKQCVAATERPSCSKELAPENGYKMRLASEVSEKYPKKSKETALNGADLAANARSSLTINAREREKQMVNPVRITSPELLSSELLQSALLYGLSQDLLPSEHVDFLPRPDAGAASPIRGKTAKKSRTHPGSPTPSDGEKGRAPKFVPAGLTRLDAGEPIRVRRWDKNQVVDFFAQTMAFDLMEEGTKK